MKMRILLLCFFLLFGCKFPVSGGDITVHDAYALLKALTLAKPGTTVLLTPGRYSTGLQLERVSGTQEKPIVITAADEQNPPVFDGGEQAFQFVDCNYIILRSIRVSGCTKNGINADDAGSFKTPSVGMVFENLMIEDIGPKGNYDGLKLSGLRNFTVRNCSFVGWGGSAIDMVGCQDGIIENCRFIGKEGFSLDNGVQTKGGSQRILIRGNFFHNAGQRAVNLGGSTGLHFFRTDLKDCEAKDIEVAGNHFVGGMTPVVYVSSTKCRVHHNTIIHPEKWVLRILQEQSSDKFLPCSHGVFESNLVVFDQRVRDFVNIGPNTQPETFIFEKNAWFCVDGDRRPSLPTEEKGGIYQVDPMLKDAGTPEMKVMSRDPQLLSIGAHSFLAPKEQSDIRKGIASQYKGDKGIENHPSVIFTEDFESGSIDDVVQNWSWNQGAKDHRLSLDTIPGPDGTPGKKSLKMTILRGIGGDGSDLRKIFDKGFEQLYLRFYVKFAEDYGFNHHFTSIRGELNPTPWHVGRAGQKPTEHFSTTIDQINRNLNNRGPVVTPPGYWTFYSYWPEMRSWQNPDGTADGRPNPYYGNNFMPGEPVPARRGEWQCVEIMIRLNSAPDKADGAHAFWIDGIPAGCWDPLEENPVRGYWFGATFRSDPDHKESAPFPGIRWRTFEDPERFEKFKINIINLQNYVSDTSWGNTDKYAAEHPDFKISLREATVWKDHVVVATEYIGPMEPK